LDQCIREKTEAHDLNGIFKELYHFCNVELSSFYFDIRKDVLYCDARTSLKYQATQVVLYHLFRCLTIWLSPIICFTAEEAWQHRFKGSSVHLERLPDLDPKWFQEALDKKWTVIRYVRRVVTGALEQERAAGTIGSSLQGCPHIYVEDENTYHTLKDQPLSEICITSQVQLVLGKPERAAFTLEDVAGVFVLVGLAEGNKCDRCWQILPEVGKSEHHPHICTRCEDAVESL